MPAGSSLKRSQTAFDGYPQRKPLKRARTDPKADEKYYQDDAGLEDIGIVRSLGDAVQLKKAMNSHQYVEENMFDPVPETAAGMNSTRIAEVLNFHRNLPRLLSVAHVHSMALSPSSAERETAQAIRAGSLRRFHVPGRGVGVSNISDLLVSTSELKRLLARSGIREATRERYLQWLRSNPFAITFPPNALKPDETVELLKAGFITSATTPARDPASSSSKLETPGVATSIQTVAFAAAGTEQAVGGPGATYGAGGGGAGTLQRRRGPAASPSSSSSEFAPSSGLQYQVTVPGAGAYLKLVTAARSHLVDLLRRAGRREAPLYLLREYWDAGLTARQTVATAAGAAGPASGSSAKPFGGLLPGQTKKWKNYYGMRFDFVLRDAFGAGLVECFNTRSVGLGIRVA